MNDFLYFLIYYGGCPILILIYYLTKNLNSNPLDRIFNKISVPLIGLGVFFLPVFFNVWYSNPVDRLVPLVYYVFYLANFFLMKGNNWTRFYVSVVSIYAFSTLYEVPLLLRYYNLNHFIPNFARFVVVFFYLDFITRMKYRYEVPLMCFMFLCLLTAYNMMIYLNPIPYLAVIGRVLWGFLLLTLNVLGEPK